MKAQPKNRLNEGRNHGEWQREMLELRAQNGIDADGATTFPALVILFGLLLFAVLLSN